MHNEIQRLSKEDEKNLSQKFAFSVKEMGELAEAILAYENADGSREIFVQKEDILDEVADVLLGVSSIAYDLGFSFDQFNEMIIKKVEKWKIKQIKDVKKEFPFEVHVTIDSYGMTEEDIQIFKEYCRENGIKGIDLILQDHNGNQINHEVMTSCIHNGTNKSVIDYINRIETILQWPPYKVIRRKIETIPTHPAAPSIANGKNMSKDCYFEAHIEVEAPKVVNKKLLDYILKISGAQYSLNKMKQNVLITYREDTLPYEMFVDKLSTLENDLRTIGFRIIDVQAEFSIFDTNVLQDAAWIKNGVASI